MRTTRKHHAPDNAAKDRLLTAFASAEGGLRDASSTTSRVVRDVPACPQHTSPVLDVPFRRPRPLSPPPPPLVNAPPSPRHLNSPPPLPSSHIPAAAPRVATCTSAGGARARQGGCGGL
ncbi:uncharacterized protein SCHCODRAFT_011174 [Schizophyllum commune H4-8]|uniref:Expressed protein n=1 Tax=Schizophyllum commune (strain H4-8 / FGSC 9210) TaxID=578458 RepID=D8Q3Z7_SCHCM|nr:uncharacterized protein SCHCODRAFT_011174 [Schizophyllum commune H4-8]KAI5892818.1 hypothetical protein SCHCODRAFT_011174 [Schizophyllum commune H4-8]